MDNLTSKHGLHQQLDVYLDRACKAEAIGDIPEAERMFRFALRCEAYSRSDVGDVSEYVRQVGPVYSQDQVVSAVAASPANDSGTVEAVSQG